jgi:hypothetical protein
MFPVYGTDPACQGGGGDTGNICPMDTLAGFADNGPTGSHHGQGGTDYVIMPNGSVYVYFTPNVSTSWLKPLIGAAAFAFGVPYLNSLMAGVDAIVTTTGAQALPSTMSVTGIDATTNTILVADNVTGATLSVAPVTGSILDVTIPDAAGEMTVPFDGSVQVAQAVTDTSISTTAAETALQQQADAAAKAAIDQAANLSLPGVTPGLPGLPSLPAPVTQAVSTINAIKSAAAALTAAASALGGAKNSGNAQAIAQAQANLAAAQNAYLQSHGLQTGSSSNTMILLGLAALGLFLLA